MDQRSKDVLVSSARRAAEQHYQEADQPTVEQAMELAERVITSHGGELDDFVEELKAIRSSLS